MQIERGDPNFEISDEDILMTVKAFYNGDDLGFDIRGGDDTTDEQILTIMSALNAVLAQSIAAMERKILMECIEKDSKKRKQEREMKTLMEKELEGDPN